MRLDAKLSPRHRRRDGPRSKVARHRKKRTRKRSASSVLPVERRLLPRSRSVGLRRRAPPNNGAQGHPPQGSMTFSAICRRPPRCYLFPCDDGDAIGRRGWTVSKENAQTCSTRDALADMLETASRRLNKVLGL